jgi:hypothetical protein
MALIKGKLIDPSTVIKQLQDPVSEQDLSRKGYVDAKAVAEALSARLQAQTFATSAASSAEVSAKSYADEKISALVNGAPEMLDTLKELADALEASEGSLEQQILTQVGLLNSKIDQEISDRQSGDNSLDGRLDIIEGPDSQVGSIAKALKDAKAYTDSEVSSEESRAQGEEQRIEEKFDEMFSYQESTNLQVDERITTEIADREAGDLALQTSINTEVTNRQQAILGEQQARQAADVSLAGDISDEVIRATAAEEALESTINQEISDRSAADSLLSGRLDVLETDPTTKTYVDGKFSAANSYTDQKVSDLVNGAPEMLDTLKELADAIDSQGGSLTEQILTQVGAVDDKVDQEILDRQAADVVLDGKITTEKNRAMGEESRIEGLLNLEVSNREAADGAIWERIDILEGSESVEGSVAKAEKDAKDYADLKVGQEQSRAQLAESGLQSQITQEVSDRQAAVSAEQSRAQLAEQNLQSQITQEISNRQSAVSAEQSRAEAAESALDSRLDVLEAAPSPKGRKEVKTMSSTDVSNAYVDMAGEAMPNTMLVSVSGTVQYEGEDYSLSVVGGVTRVTFTGDLTPDGDGAALVVGDKVHFQYMVMSTSEQSSGGGGSGGGGGGGGSEPASSVTLSYSSPYSTFPNWNAYQFNIQSNTSGLDSSEIYIMHYSMGEESRIYGNHSNSKPFTAVANPSNDVYVRAFKIDPTNGTELMKPGQIPSEINPMITWLSPEYTLSWISG